MGGEKVRREREMWGVQWGRSNKGEQSSKEMMIEAGDGAWEKGRKDG